MCKKQGTSRLTTPIRGSGQSGSFQNISRAGLSRVDRVSRLSNSQASDRVTHTVPEPTGPDPTRPDPRGLIRPVNSRE